MKKFAVTSILTFVLGSALAQDLSFTASVESGCAPLSIDFTNTSTDESAVNIEWDMDDGTILTGDEVTHTFDEGDSYFVTMSAYTADWTLIDFVDKIITVEGIQGFGTNTEIACPDEEVFFFADAGATSYSWDFGDGTSGTGAEVTKSYTELGSYTVTLTANYESCGVQTQTTSVSIDSGSTPDVSMQFSDENVCPGEAISFFTLTEGETYLWDFGDGSTSSDKSTSHAYESLGEYTVTLSVTNGCGNTGTHTQTVNLSSTANWPGNLDFTVNNTAVCPNQEVIFEGIEGNYTYQFDLGNEKDTIDTELPELSYAYDQEGFYTVGLTYFNACGADTTLFVTVDVTTEFSFVDELFLEAEKEAICPNTTNSYSAPEGYEWYVWDFGDGSDKDSIRSAENTHLYESVGEFETKLRIYNACGADSLLTTSLIVSTDSEVIDDDIIITHASTVCPNAVVDFFIDQAFESYIWSFGDGSEPVESSSGNIEYTYEQNGQYEVSLIVSNTCGNTREVITSVLVDDNQEIPTDLTVESDNAQVCPGTSVSFFTQSGYQSYVWFLNDTKLDSTASPSYEAELDQVGDANVAVKIYNTCGRSATFSTNVEVRDDLPFAEQVDFFSSATSACPDEVLNFFVTEDFSNYQWSFGDGEVIDDGDDFESYSFAEVGEYEVRITVTNSCGQDSVLTQLISVGLDSPIPTDVALSAEEPSSCPGAEVNLSTSLGFERYVWNFGDGSSAVETTLSDVVYAYANAGSYDISVTLFNSCGSDSTLSLTHEVKESAGFPDQLFITSSPQSACPGEEMIFLAPEGYQSYAWDFGDGSTDADSISAQSSNIYDTIGEYTVSVSFENTCGNTNILDYLVSIQSNAPFDPTLVLEVDAEANCPGDAFLFTAPDGYSDYVWDFGPEANGETFSNQQEVAFSFDQLGEQEVTVSFQNSCGNDTTLFSTVSVGEAVSRFDGTFLEFQDGVCPNTSIIFQTKLGYSEYNWDFGDGTTLTTTTAEASHAYATLDAFDLSLTIKNACGSDTTLVAGVLIGDDIFIEEEIAFDAPEEVCPGELFVLSGPVGFIRYEWLVDGETLLTDESSIQYALDEAGSYDFSLSVFNACGSDTTFAATTLVGAGNGELDDLMTLTSSADEVCTGSEVGFFLEAEGLDTHFWTVGNESFFGDEEIFIAFEEEGTFDVSVLATNFCGQDTTLTTSVIVSNTSQNGDRLIELEVDKETACAGEAFEFEATRGFKTYEWTFGDGETETSTSEIISHAYASFGNYIVSVSASDNCSNVYDISTVVEVSESRDILSEIELQTSAVEVCQDEPISFSVLGADDSFTFEWILGDSTVTSASSAYSVEVTQSGTYQAAVMVSDLCGNSAMLTADFIVSESAPLSFVNFGVDGDEDRAGCPGDVVTFFFEGEHENVWNFGDGTTLSGIETVVSEDGIVSTIVRHAYAEAGVYDVTLDLTNSCNGTSSQTTQVTVGGDFAAETSISLSAEDPEIGYPRCALITLIASGGVAFDWDFGDGAIGSSVNPTIQHSYDVAGSYQVFVDITNGCGIVQRENITITVANQAAPTIVLVESTNPSCFGLQDGSLQVDASGFEPLTYQWNIISSDNTESKIAALKSGAYSVTVTDRFGCYSTEAFILEEGGDITLNETVTDANCGAADGAINLGLENPETFTYLWNDDSTDGDRSSLGAGNYSVTITSTTGCTLTQSFSINETDAPVITSDIQQVACAGEANGKITLNLNSTEVQSILWSTGSTESFIDGQSAGEYSVTVTGTNGCISTSNFVLDDPQEIQVEVTKEDGVCGSKKGFASVVASGGTGTLSYTWSHGKTGSELDDLDGGSYTVTVSDENGCEKTADVEIVESVVLEVESTVTNVTCFGESNGSISVTPNKGLVPYSYSWATGETTSELSNLAAGSYEVTVTDAEGCSINESFEVTAPAELAAIDLGVDKEICVDESVIFEVAAVYDSVIWSTGSNDLSITIRNADFGGGETLELWVKGFNENKCFVADTVILTSKVCEEELATVKIKVEVYPNPVNTFTKISFGSKADRTIRIFSLEGKEVVPSLNTNQQSVDLDLSNLDNGLYLIQVREGVRVETVRVIKR
ncbi:MAG: PKD domain-containing protein [Cyclobacteriaceae bacterium]